LIALCCFPAFAAEPVAMKWTIDGTEREALVYAPAKTSGARKAPLVFVFHWHGGSMQAAAAGMKFQTLWPEAIAVYMQGLPTKIYVDPMGVDPGWQQEPGQFGDRDLRFFDAVLASLHSTFPVDNHRIYATGFSNGGIFTYLLWGTRGKTFAAFAPVSGQKFSAVRLTEPRPVLHIAGQKDDVVPFREQVQSVLAAKATDGSAEAGTSCGQNCTTYRSTRNAPVNTYFHPAGHVYPPGASEMIVKFFKNHELAD
jgi:polyhydroxybutyrate depolymerase